MKASFVLLWDERLEREAFDPLQPCAVGEGRNHFYQNYRHPQEQVNPPVIAGDPCFHRRFSSKANSFLRSAATVAVRPDVLGWW